MKRRMARRQPQDIVDADLMMSDFDDAVSA